MSDLISRQAAIDLVKSFYKIDKSVLKIMVFKLKQLPSVQPETNCSEIPNNSDLISRQAAIRIAEQGQVQGYEWQFKKLCELPSVQLELSNNSKELENKNGELISRQDVIKAVTYGALSSATLFGRSDAGMTALRETVRAIKALPSAQPRRGKWAGKGDSEGFGIFICDNCGKFAMMEYDFCPNCGCRMEEGDAE